MLYGTELQGQHTWLGCLGVCPLGWRELRWQLVGCQGTKKHNSKPKDVLDDRSNDERSLIACLAVHVLLNNTTKCFMAVILLCSLPPIFKKAPRWIYQPEECLAVAVSLGHMATTSRNQGDRITALLLSLHVTNEYIQVLQAPYSTLTVLSALFPSFLLFWTGRALVLPESIMSGMEPLAVFGIACNTMQVIQFTFEAVSICKKVFETGLPDPGLRQFVGDSARLYTNIDQSIRDITPHTDDDKQFLRIVQNTRDVSEQLKDEVDKIARTAAKGKFVASVTAGVKAKLREKRIRKLVKRMQEYQRILESGFLDRIW